MLEPLLLLKKRLHARVPAFWNPAHWRKGHDAGRCGLYNAVAWQALKSRQLRLAGWEVGTACLVLGRSHCFIAINDLAGTPYVLDLTCQQIKSFQAIPVLLKPAQWVRENSPRHWWESVHVLTHCDDRTLAVLKSVVDEDFPPDCTWEDLALLGRAGL